MSEVYRDGAVHVLAQRCATCIFRPGNLMQLEPGRVRAMVDGSVAAGAAITCHSTLYRHDDVGEAICRGFYDAHAQRVPLLQLAERLGIVTEVAPPSPDGEDSEQGSTARPSSAGAARKDRRED